MTPPPAVPPLIGMVHLQPLVGAPRFGGSMDEVVAGAVEDARILERAGFDALMIENFGDAPFYSDDVPKATVAAMTRAVLAIKGAVGLPVGVNVLRNDALAAMAIAGATGAAMIRVNVLSGLMYTDQGPIVGRADELARARASLRNRPLVLADVFVKHATPPPGLTIEQAALDTWERAGADALVVSGSGTGTAVEMHDAAAVRSAVPDASIVIGSGATAANVATLRAVADSVIVGSSLKAHIDHPIDPTLAAAFVEEARRAGFGP